MGQHVMRWREKLRFSGRALGRAAGKSHGYIKKLEAGEIANPGLDTLEAIARVMGFEGLTALMAADPDRADTAPAPLTDDERTRRIVRDELARSGGVPVTEAPEEKVATIPHRGVVAGGTGAGEYDEGKYEIPRSWIKGRDLFALTVRGDCMARGRPGLAGIHDGTTVICERVYRPDQAPNSDRTDPWTRYVVWVEGREDDLGGNLKYVERFSKKARLTADDDTKIIVDDVTMVHIVGRVIAAYIEF